MEGNFEAPIQLQVNLNWKIERGKRETIVMEGKKTGTESGKYFPDRIDRRKRGKSPLGREKEESG